MASAKGISPLIAAVLLIAIVIAIVNITGPWMQNFLKHRFSEVEEGGQKKVKCIYTSIDYDDSDVTWSKNRTNHLTGDSVNITVENSGNEKLYNFTINYVVDGTSYSGNIIRNQPTSDDALKSGSETVLITEIQNTTSLKNKQLKKVRVSTRPCPNVERICDMIDEECQ